MLSIVGSTTEVRTRTTYDNYVPLTFRNILSSDVVPCYWLSGDFDAQLIEIGLHPDTGAIQKVVVSGLGKQKHRSSDRGITYRNLTHAVPLCDTSRWSHLREMKDWHKNNFVREKAAFTAAIYATGMAIQFTEETEIYKGYQADDVIFGENSAGFLTCIEYKPVNQQDFTCFLKVL